MKDFISLEYYLSDDIFEIFSIAKQVTQGEYSGFLKGKTVIMFFPELSIRTRVSFEKGIYLLGGQVILFSPSVLDKKENLKDVCGYLNNWADIVVVRHKDINVIKRMSEYLTVPVINAMTDVNHPCEVVSDMYALSCIRKDYLKDKYLFVGKRGNIGLAWREASRCMGFTLEQCCGKGYEIDGLVSYDNIEEAVIGKDIVCTDSLSADELKDFAKCQVSKDIMDKANKGAILNPCAPFFRGEEVSDDVIESEYFVGYGFKKCLLEVQQAILIYCLVNG